MSSQPTVVAQPVVVHVLCGWCGDMLCEAQWLVVQHSHYSKQDRYPTIHQWIQGNDSNEYLRDHSYQQQIYPGWQPGTNEHRSG